jgi:hypothetical protein
MNCSRCRGLMHAEEFRDWQCGIGMDRFRALRCLVCGEIVDSVIVQNRLNTPQGKILSCRRRVRRRATVLAVRAHRPMRRSRPVMGRFNG